MKKQHMLLPAIIVLLVFTVGWRNGDTNIKGNSQKFRTAAWNNEGERVVKAAEQHSGQGPYGYSDGGWYKGTDTSGGRPQGVQLMYAGEGFLPAGWPIGMDCIGFVYVVFTETGHGNYRPDGYSKVVDRRRSCGSLFKYYRDSSPGNCTFDYSLLNCATKDVNDTNADPGDIIIFKDQWRPPPPTSGNWIQLISPWDEGIENHIKHVGIYAGNSYMVHMNSNRVEKTKFNNIYGPGTATDDNRYLIAAVVHTWLSHIPSLSDTLPTPPVNNLVPGPYLNTTYHPLPPARLLDTRINSGLSGKIYSNKTRAFRLTGNGGVPANATAVTGNITVTRQTSAGYLYIGPAPSDYPPSSTLNFPVGDNRANGVTAGLGYNGTLSITFGGATLNDTIHAIFDVTGYFTPDMSGAAYVPVPPARLLNTKNGTGLSGVLNANTARSFNVTGFSGIPVDAIAVTGWLTVSNPTAAGYLYIGPDPMDIPTSSTLNFPAGDTRTNGVTVALSIDDTLSVTYAGTAAGNTAHAIFDVTGYYTPGTPGGTFVPLASARLLDTRKGTGLTGAFSGNTSRTFQVSGRGGVPLDALAVTGNLTVTRQTSAGYLYIGPDPTNSPACSTLNFPAGDNRAASVTIALGTDGTLSATFAGTTSNNTAHVIFDVTGYMVKNGE